MKFTVLGGRGFIGRHLLEALARTGVEAVALEPGAIGQAALGHVIYAAGVTADFRRRPFDTVEAHVSVLSEVLRGSSFSSFLYLSSTRVYGSARSTREGGALMVDPARASDLYNLSKLLGEALCLAQPRREIRVARLSNVWGFDAKSENFVPSLVRDALGGRLELQSSPESCKDYVGIADVVDLLPRISRVGSQRIYNVASGVNVTHGAIVDELKRLTSCTSCVRPAAPKLSFPKIDTTRVAAEFDWQPRSLIAALPQLVEEFREAGPFETRLEASLV